MWKRDKSRRPEAKDKKDQERRDGKRCQIGEAGRAGQMLRRRDREQTEAKWLIRAGWSIKGLHGPKHNQLTVTKLSHCFFYWDFATT